MTAAYERCGFAGERVLGFAYKAVQAQAPELYKTEAGAPPTEGLVFMGLLSLQDPPKQGVLQVIVRSCFCAMPPALRFACTSSCRTGGRAAGGGRCLFLHALAAAFWPCI